MSNGELLVVENETEKGVKRTLFLDSNVIALAFIDLYSFDFTLGWPIKRDTMLKDMLDDWLEGVLPSYHWGKETFIQLEWITSDQFFKKTISNLKSSMDIMEPVYSAGNPSLILLNAGRRV